MNNDRTVTPGDDDRLVLSLIRVDRLIPCIQAIPGKRAGRSPRLGIVGPSVELVLKLVVLAVGDDAAVSVQRNIPDEQLTGFGVSLDILIVRGLEGRCDPRWGRWDGVVRGSDRAGTTVRHAAGVGEVATEVTDNHLGSLSFLEVNVVCEVCPG